MMIVSKIQLGFCWKEISYRQTLRQKVLELAKLNFTNTTSNLVLPKFSTCRRNLILGNHSCGMNSKHLDGGSEYPTFDEGKLRIYTMRFCPFAQRVVLVAEAKGISHDIVNVNLKNKPDWFLAKNPAGTVPTIETSNGPLYESLIIADYLDDAYPCTKLIPTNAYQWALDRILIEKSSKIAGAFYKLMFGMKDDTATNQERLQALEKTLAPFEVELKRRGTPFFGGPAPGMLDYILWPWFERIPVLKIFFPDLYDYENAKTENPHLENWRQAMKEDKAVKACYLPPKIHHQFMMGYIAGEPKYDFDYNN